MRYIVPVRREARADDNLRDDDEENIDPLLRSVKPQAALQDHRELYPPRQHLPSEELHPLDDRVPAFDAPAPHIYAPPQLASDAPAAHIYVPPQTYVHGRDTLQGYNAPGPQGYIPHDQGIPPHAYNVPPPPGHPPGYDMPPPPGHPPGYDMPPPAGYNFPPPGHNVGFDAPHGYPHQPGQVLPPPPHHVAPPPAGVPIERQADDEPEIKFVDSNPTQKSRVKRVRAQTTTGNIEKRLRGGRKAQNHGHVKAESNTADTGADDGRVRTGHRDGSAVIELESDDDVLGNRWTVAERSALFDFVLGTENDDNFELSKRNPGQLWKKVAQRLFPGRHSDNAVRSQWDRSLKTYGWILEYEAFTGGAGDGDFVNQERIDAARRGGHNIGSLSAKVVGEWCANDWKELFDSRYKDSPKFKREVPRNSEAPLSSDEIDRVDNSDGDEDARDSRAKSRTPKASTSPRAQVTEPKHKAAQRSRQAASQSVEGLGAYLKEKVDADRQHYSDLLSTRKERLELEKAQLKLKEELEKKEMSLKAAKDILQMPNASADLKAAAEKVLFRLLE